MDAFMKDVLNVKPVFLKQNAPEMDAFQQRLFNSQRDTYFWLKLDAPKTNCLSCQRCCQHWTFLFDTMPPRWMPLWKMFSMWSQLFFSKMPPKWMPFSKDFSILSVTSIFCWNLMPQNQCLSWKRRCQHWTFFVWHNAPKMDAFMTDVLNVKPVLLKQNAPEMDAFQQRLFNSQRETYFLLKPDAPQNQCLSCQRCCQHWTFFVWHNAPN